MLVLEELSNDKVGCKTWSEMSFRFESASVSLLIKWSLKSTKAMSYQPELIVCIITTCGDSNDEIIAGYNINSQQFMALIQ